MCYVARCFIVVELNVSQHTTCVVQPGVHYNVPSKIAHHLPGMTDQANQANEVNPANHAIQAIQANPANQANQANHFRSFFNILVLVCQCFYNQSHYILNISKRLVDLE